MVDRKVAVLIAAAAIVLVACSSGAPSAGSGSVGVVRSPSASVPLDSATASGPASACVVGVSPEDRSAERWVMWDEPAIKKTLNDAGATYLAGDAKSTTGPQAAEVEGLISKGAKVLIIGASDETAIAPTVASAIKRGIPVIAYDRLIEDPKVLYITFDNVEVGRMQARALLKAVPKGDYVFIKGDKANANADFLRAGQDEVLSAAIKSGACMTGSEAHSPSLPWSTTSAMRSCRTRSWARSPRTPNSRTGIPTISTGSLV